MDAGYSVTSAAQSTGQQPRALWLLTTAGSSGLGVACGAGSGACGSHPSLQSLVNGVSTRPASDLAAVWPTLCWDPGGEGNGQALCPRLISEAQQLSKGTDFGLQGSWGCEEVGASSPDGLFLSRFIYSLEINGLWSSGHSHCLGMWGQGELRRPDTAPSLPARGFPK